jgi:HEAT repeat protein
MSLELIIAAGMLVGLLYLLAVAQLFLARLRNSRRTRRQDRIERTWLPILVAETAEVPATLPALDASDVIPFLTLWNQLQESFTGDITRRLNEVARRVGADAAARHLLQRRSLRDRLLAVSTLGHLGDRGDQPSWNALVRLTSDRDGMLSLAAARALTRIDAAAALPVILPRLVERTDWSRNYVLGMLVELGADVVSRPLTEAALQAPPDRAPTLLQYFSAAHVADAVPVVRAIIARTTHVECLAACLRVFADVDQLDTVREYLRHPSWQVRVQAVNVLGRLGGHDDYQALLPLLSDPEWWVRYRAAKTLCALPGVDLPRVRTLSEQHHDAFARDMLVHVLAEAGA